MKRRLSAIMSADLVGYSRLIRSDEEGTISTFNAIRTELIEPAINGHNGRVVKLMGDGLLVEFSSVVGAVRSAIDIQEAITTRNSGLSNDHLFQFRIGINLGDVIIDGDDIHGDGVNLAARLEGLAQPSGISISESVYQLVRDRIGVQFEELGEQTVKNIDRPVHVWHWHPSGKIASNSSSSTKTLALPNKPSIVVLPFKNLSSDPEQEYFSDGVSEDIITDLSKLSGLFVIARNSAFAYKGKESNIPEICQELGVRFALEGSIRKFGNRVRITSQLIDGTTGGQIWAERYDRELADIFDLQDEVTQKIIAELAPKLTETKKMPKTRHPTENLEAYDYLLRGRDLWWRLTKQSNAEARSMFERTVELDQNFALAFAWLAAAHLVDAINKWGESREQSEKLHAKFARHAVSLDNLDSFSHVQLGMAYLRGRQHKLAIEEGEKAIDLDANFAHARLDLAWFLLYSGRFTEALTRLVEVERLDPHFPDVILHIRALCYFHTNRVENAVANLKRRLTRNPNSDLSNILLASCYGHLGRITEAQAAWREGLKINPGFSLEHRRNELPYKNLQDIEYYLEGLKKGGIDLEDIAP